MSTDNEKNVPIESILESPLEPSSKMDNTKAMKLSPKKSRKECVKEFLKCEKSCGTQKSAKYPHLQGTFLMNGKK